MGREPLGPLMWKLLLTLAATANVVFAIVLAYQQHWDQATFHLALAVLIQDDLK